MNRCIFCLLFIGASYVATAQTTYYSRQNGAWNNPNTWSTVSHLGAAAATLPGSVATDIVLIGSGHVVDLNPDKGVTNAATIATLTLDDDGGGGTLRLPYSNFNPAGTADDLNAAFTLSVTGNVTLNAGGNILSVEGGSGVPVMGGAPANRTHNFNIAGNLTMNNAATFDMEATTTARKTNLTFNGTTNQTISGEPTVDTWEVAYANTGVSPNDQVINSSVTFTTAIEGDRTTFTSGTYVHNNAGTYTGEDNAGYTINSNIIIQGGIFNMIVNHSTDRTGTINGDLTITAGQFNGGSNGAGIISNLTINGTLTVSGTGVLNIGDGDPSGPTYPTDATLTINGIGSTVNGTTCFTHDLTLSAGADLVVSNGALVSIGDNISTGLIVMNGGVGNGSTLTINDAATNFDVFGETDVNEECIWTVNDGTVDIMPNATEATDSDPNAITLDVTGAQFNVNGGTVNFLSSNDDAGGNAKGVIFDADNTSMTVTAGTVNIGNTTTGQGNVRFRQAIGLTATLTISGGTVNIFDDFERNNNGAICNVSVTGGSILNVGLGATTSNARSEIDGGTFTIGTDGTDVNFGGPITANNIVMSNNVTFDIGTIAGTTANSFIEGTFNKTTANTISFESGMQVETGANVTVAAGTINIFQNVATMTTSNDDDLYINGNLTINGGTINVGAGVTSVTSGTAFRIRDGSTVNIIDGTINVLTNAGLTAISGGNLVNMQNNGTGTETLTIGDGTGSAASAVLTIAPNLAAELPTPTTRFVFDMDGANATTTVNSDGLLQVGGGNVGNLRLNTIGAAFTQNGGTVNVTASLTVDDGTTLTVAGGTLNVGVSASNGANGLVFQGNPTAITSVAISGGTVNIGDGNSVIRIGNGNNNPAFGSLVAYHDLNITGGTVNVNGGMWLDDANARFRMSAGNLNLNPQLLQNLISTSNILYLDRGIVGITGGTITELNPNSTSGSGRAFRTSDGGDPNSASLISDFSLLPGFGNVDFSSATMNFGDGSEAKAGSVDGFDLNLSANHTYGTFVVNNPSGSNRHVEITNTGNNYSFGADLTVMAGDFDINDNTIDRSVAGGTLSVGSGGNLIIGNTNGLNHFPGSTAGGGAAFTTYTLDLNSTITYDGAGNANVDIPGGPDEFGNLSILGSGNKTLSAVQTVRNVLTLTGGTFVASTNLTMASGSKILRTNTDASGIMTGVVQGANAYTIEYTGVTKTTQGPEWSGSGAKSLIINLTTGQILTLHTTLTAGGDLTITSGTLEDAGTTFTVNGNVSNSDTHTGTGKILITGGSAIHNFTGDGTGSFTNLELSDAGFDAQLFADQTVNGVLTLTDGVLNIDTYLLTLSTTASISVASPGTGRMIQVEGTTAASGVNKAYTGVESFTWPIGVSGKYTPATINVTSTGAGGTITLFPVNSQSPFTTQDPPVNLEISYYWSTSTTGFSSPIATHTYTYDQADATGRGNEAAYIPARYVPVTWSTINDVSQVDEVLNTITFSGVTYLNGDFTAAEPSEFGVVLTYYSRADGNWSTVTSWSNTGFGGPAATTIPGSDRPVLVGNNNTITVAANNIFAGSLDLQSTGTLVIGDGTSGHNFGTVTGTGLLQIVSNSATTPIFPGGTFASFVSSSGGTVEYMGTGSYTMPTSETTYNHLAISGSSASTKTLPDADLTLNGSLTVSGTNTTAQVSATTNGNLTIAGNVTTVAGTILRFMDGTARTVIVSGDVTNAGTFDVENVGTSSHSLSIGGNLANAGIFDMSTASTVNTTFTGATNTAISGAGGTTDFNRLIVNKGGSSSNILDVTATNFTLSASTNSSPKALEIQNGTFRISAAHTVTLSTNGDFSIPSSGGLSLNNAGATAEITTATGNLDFAGLVELLDGTLNIGDDATGVLVNDLVYETGSAALTVSGGTLNVSGAITSNPATATLAYNQSAGTVNVARYKSTTSLGNNNTGDFVLSNSGSSFTMSGGTIKIIRANTSTDGKAIRIVSGVTSNVTGGTIQVAVAGTTLAHDIGITSSVPFWDFHAGDGAGFTGNIGTPTGGQQDLTIANDLIINLGGEFRLHRASDNTRDDRNNIDLNLAGDFTVTSGTFVPGDEAVSHSVVTFNGTTTPQIITGTSNFYDIVINNTAGGGTIQLAAATDVTLEGDWTLTAGAFDGATNSGLVTFNGAVAAQNILGNPTTFYDLEINDINSVVLGASSTTVSNNLTLTAGLFNIGANGLNLTNTAATAIQGTPDVTKMILVDGTTSAAGVTKSYPNAASNFTFPVGSSVLKYTPATLNVTTADGAGTITVFPVNTAHPNAPGTDFLNYYWKVQSSGIGNSVVVNHTYVYDQSDVNGTETNFIDGNFDGTQWFTGFGTVNDVTNTITINGFTGEIANNAFTAGFGFSNPAVYYSNLSGNWNGGTGSSGTSTWSIDPAVFMAPPTAEPSLSTPVVIRAHTVTIVANNENAASVDIPNAAGILDMGTFTGQNFGIGVSGIGTLKTSAANLPTLVASFVSSSGGTIEFTDGGTGYTLPTQATFNNLTFSGTGTETLSTNLSIAGNLSINAGVVDLSTFTANRSSAGGTFTIAAGAQLDVNGASNFPANFITHTFNTTSTVRYVLQGDQTIDALGGDAYGNIVIQKNNNSTAGPLRTKTMNGSIDVNGDLTIGRETQLDAAGFDITLAGDWSRDRRNNSAFIPGTGSITFDGSVAQTISITGGAVQDGEVFNNITFSNPAGVSTSGNLNQIDCSDLTITAGAFNLNNDPLNISGNLTNNVGVGGFLNPGLVTFNNTGSNQSIGGSAGTNFINLTMAQASGLTLTLNQPVTVSGTLTMQNDGNIVLSGTTNDLTIGSGGGLAGTFSATRMIVTGGTNTASQLIQTGISANANSYDFTFPIGVGSNYTPLVINASAITDTGNGTIAVRSVDGNNGQLIVGEENRALNRYFMMDMTSITDITGSFDFTYVNSDVQGTEVNYISRYWNGAAWTRPDDVTVGAPFTDFVTSASNLFGGSAGTLISTANTEWTAGEPGSMFPKLYSNVAPSGNWNIVASWALDAGGTMPATAAPTEENDVVVQNGDRIIMVNNNESSASLDIASGGTLAIGTTIGHSVGALTGAGTLELESGTIPTYNPIGTTFFNSGNGTVDYAGIGSYTTSSSQLTYNNLTISGGGTKTLGGSATIAGNLVINASTLDADAANNFDITLGGSLSTPGGGSLIPRLGTFTLNGASPQSLPALTFNNIVFDNSGTKSITSAIASVNDFTILPASGTVSTTNNINIQGDWSNSAGQAAFSSTATVTFDNTGATQSMSGSTRFNNLVVSKNAQTLDISGNVFIDNTITLNSNVTENVSVASTLNLNGAGTQDVLGTAGSIAFGSLVIDGPTTHNYNANMTINKNLTVNTGTLQSGSPVSFTLSGNVSTAVGATLDGTNISAMTLAGNWTNSGSFTAGSSVVTFNGSATQTLSGSTNFNSLTINNTSTGTSIDQQAPIQIGASGTLTFTDGVVVGSAVNTITLLAGAASSCPSNASYFEGKMIKTGATDFEFCIGKGGVYAPIEVTGITASSTFDAEYFFAAPSNPTLTDGTFNHASGAEYWDLVRSAGTGNAFVTLHWDDPVRSDISDLPDLLVTHYNSGVPEWDNKGNGGTTGSAVTAGTIISNVRLTSFSPVTFGSLNGLNALPIELSYFRATAGTTSVKLEWETASEHNNDFFTLERSADGESFEAIELIDGAGDSAQPIQYTYLDTSPINGLSYYRLKQTDFDGMFSYSDVVAVNVDLDTSIPNLTIYPSPVEPGNLVSYTFLSNTKGPGQLVLRDQLGKLVASFPMEKSGEIINGQFMIPSSSKGGIYFVTAQFGETAASQRIIIR